jgi:tRNA threonylcarbamoyladenosine biosynthesis protein TsaB
MAIILNIETATTLCSVSLAQQGKLLAFKELDSGFTHAENLHGFILEILQEAGIGINALQALAVSKGPGSYTGLRIGVSAAKGLAYALRIPLISLDTLQVMSHQAAALKKEDVIYCPMIDARRMEVYTALYNQALDPVSPVEALIVDEHSIKKFNAYPSVYFFGDGMPKCRELLSALPNAGFINDMKPSAVHMCGLSYARFMKQEFEDVAYFEPFYLKDFLITRKNV